MAEPLMLRDQNNDLIGPVDAVSAALPYVVLTDGDKAAARAALGAAAASALATPSFARYSVADGNATAGQTTLTVSPYTPGALLVFVNGSKLPTNAYTATSGASVVLADPIQATDVVEVLSWLMSGVQNAAPISHQHNVSDILGLAAFVTSYLASLPTSLPATPGQPWWNGGMLSKS